MILVLFISLDVSQFARPQKVLSCWHHTEWSSKSQLKWNEMIWIASVWFFYCFFRLLLFLSICLLSYCIMVSKLQIVCYVANIIGFIMEAAPSCCCEWLFLLCSKYGLLLFHMWVVVFFFTYFFFVWKLIQMSRPCGCHYFFFFFFFPHYFSQLNVCCLLVANAREKSINTRRAIFLL